MALSERRTYSSFAMSPQRKRLLLFTSKLGYQTRSFDDAAAELGLELIFVTDRCHQLEDPWGDRAVAVHFESPEIRATREAHLDQMLVEGYIPGREVAVEGLLTDGSLRILAIFDKPDPLEGPYFEETVYVTPSRLPAAQQRAIEQCAHNAVRALGLSHGPIHAEFRVDEERVWPLEVAPRPIGGLCARALRFAGKNTGAAIGLEELLLRHALNLPGSDLPREQSPSGVMMIAVPKSGILEKVEGEEASRATPGITELHITARMRDYVAAWPEGSSYLGFIFARGKTP